MYNPPKIIKYQLQNVSHWFIHVSACAGTSRFHWLYTTLMCFILALDFTTFHANLNIHVYFYFLVTSINISVFTCSYKSRVTNYEQGAKNQVFINANIEGILNWFFLDFLKTGITAKAMSLFSRPKFHNWFCIHLNSF